MELTVVHEGSGLEVCRGFEPALAEVNVLAEPEALAGSWGAPGTITSDRSEVFSLRGRLDYATSNGIHWTHGSTRPPRVQPHAVCRHALASARLPPSDDRRPGAAVGR